MDTNDYGKTTAIAVIHYMDNTWRSVMMVSITIIIGLKKQDYG